MNKLILLAILLIVVACNSPEKGSVDVKIIYPESVQHKEGDIPVKSAEKFIKMRLIFARKALDSFNTYVTKVKEGDLNDIATYLNDGKYIRAEQKVSTKSLVNDFIASAPGAYLSDHDKEYLRRLLDEARVDLQKKRKEIDAAQKDFKAKDDSTKLTMSDYRKYFVSAVRVREHLKNLTDEDLDTINTRFHTALEKNGLSDFWEHLIYEDKRKIDELLKSNYSAFDTCVDEALAGFMADDLNHSEKELTELIFKQEYRAYVFDYHFVELGQTGINFFFQKEVERIDERLKKTLQGLRTLDEVLETLVNPRRDDG